ncbi:hypothetical protein CAAN1_23S02520 [[Candida] anglica]|uniref:non-specific serine/threonine protein kinase n=1 Tax=[Candida] anglica TaxID=148631 RepID=A0ABP0ECD3_9ASCO
MSIGSQYEALEVIGRGSYGIVRRVRQISDGTVLVRKEIEYNSMNAQERNQLISELRILRELNHPNIVKYYAHDHIPEKSSIHIYMEYCDGGDLASVVSNFKKNREVVPEEFVWEVLVQTLLALHRCHYGIEAAKVNLFESGHEGKNEPKIDSETVVIHRDIKPDNIFMMDGGETIKLGDFGLAKMLTSRNDFAKTYVGTPYYMSPEVLMDNPYSPVCDIWSLGCVLYELCTLQPPFQAKTHLQLQQKIKLGTFHPVPEQNYSSQLRQIIHECITVDPDVRPSCFELLDTLPVRFLRKERELKEKSATLADFQKQLMMKNDELKKKESFLNSLERKVFTQREDLETEYVNMQKKFNAQRKRVEDELMGEFELRKKAMDQEALEVCNGYKREFAMVVEQEVRQRVKEIMKNVPVTTGGAGPASVVRSSSSESHGSGSSSRPVSSSSSAAGVGGTTAGAMTAQGRVYETQQPTSPSKLPRPQGPRDMGSERTPLKSRNVNDYEEYHYKTPPPPHLQQPTRMPGNNYRTRITDELARVNIEKRHTPEFEELYYRNNVNNYRS